MAFKVQDDAGRRVTYSGEPSPELLESGANVLDVLNNPWGAGADLAKVATANAEVERKFAEDARRGIPVPTHPPVFRRGSEPVTDGPVSG